MTTQMLPFSAWLQTTDAHDVACFVFDKHEYIGDVSDPKPRPRFYPWTEAVACVQTFTDAEREALDLFNREFCTRHREGWERVVPSITAKTKPTRDDRIDAALELSRRLPRIPAAFCVFVVQIMARWDRTLAYAHHDDPRDWIEWLFEYGHISAAAGSDPERWRRNLHAETREALDKRKADAA